MVVETTARSHAAQTPDGLRIDFHEYTEPPGAMIVDAILGRVRGGPPPQGAEPYELPENLARCSARTGSAGSQARACCSSSVVTPFPPACARCRPGTGRSE